MTIEFQCYDRSRIEDVRQTICDIHIEVRAGDLGLTGPFYSRERFIPSRLSRRAARHATGQPESRRRESSSRVRTVGLREDRRTTTLPRLPGLRRHDARPPPRGVNHSVKSTSFTARGASKPSTASSPSLAHRGHLGREPGSLAVSGHQSRRRSSARRARSLTAYSTAWREISRLGESFFALASRSMMSRRARSPGPSLASVA